MSFFKLRAGRHTIRCAPAWAALMGCLWLCAGSLAAMPPPRRGAPRVCPEPAAAPPRTLAWGGEGREAKSLAPEPVGKGRTEASGTFWPHSELPQDDPMFLDTDAFGRNTHPVMVRNGSGAPVQMSLPEWDLPQSMYTYVRSLDEPDVIQVLSWKKRRSLRIEAGAKLYLGVSYPALRHFQFTFADGRTETIPIHFHPPARPGACPPEQCLGLEAESKGQTTIQRSKDF